MGWDAEDAEDAYWASSGNYPITEAAARKASANNWRRARKLGYTDEEIMAMDYWPWVSPQVTGLAGKRSKRFDKYRFGPRTSRENRAMKERTSPIGEPDGFDQDGTMSATDAAYFERWAGMYPDSKNVAAIKGRMQMINKKQVIADLKKAIADAQKELALLERIPAEPGERMTSFTVTFANSTKPYVYVGLRIDGQWRMSGKHFHGSNWTWGGIFKRFEEIGATVSYISTPTEFRHEQVHH